MDTGVNKEAEECGEVREQRDDLGAAGSACPVRHPDMRGLPTRVIVDDLEFVID